MKETNSWILEKINKINKSLANLTKNEYEKDPN
jgi:hypothetical protein